MVLGLGLGIGLAQGLQVSWAQQRGRLPLFLGHWSAPPWGSEPRLRDALWELSLASTPAADWPVASHRPFFIASSTLLMLALVKRVSPKEYNTAATLSHTNSFLLSSNVAHEVEARRFLVIYTLKIAFLCITTPTQSLESTHTPRKVPHPNEDLRFSR